MFHISLLSRVSLSRTTTATISRNSHPWSSFKPRSLSTTPPSITPSATVATPPIKSKTPRFSRRHPYIFYTILFPVTLLGSVVLITTGFLIHDAFTYQDRHVDKVQPELISFREGKNARGGSKRLKVANMLVDDELDEDKPDKPIKKRLVIVGGGWGVSFIHPL